MIFKLLKCVGCFLFLGALAQANEPSGATQATVTNENNGSNAAGDTSATHEKKKEVQARHHEQHKERHKQKHYEKQRDQHRTFRRDMKSRY